MSNSIFYYPGTYVENFGLAQRRLLSVCDECPENNSPLQCTPSIDEENQSKITIEYIEYK